ncbi:GOLPH3/VPS74 family protein [Phycicoccus sonneratiae]|uniref:GPP34 family phosphoprotein n=1 Tax=Phycicoccus sonneratiae TaxID=2807628 RepID=A0ABS2CIN8_9MICO|nr:GPP34 family phosphoprotein [Phycicoccus sonneraticus]MBM6399739.1 GPP34 family phosphoprotein [Phycicoccus sonneraticus]
MVGTDTATEEATMTLSLTEELVLLTLDPHSGRPALDSVRMKAAVAGAAVAQLTLDGALALDGPDPKRARLRRTGTAAPTDPLLSDALEQADGRRPKDAVSRLGGAGAWRDRAGALRTHLLDAMAAAGVVRREDDRVLGLFPRTRWSVADPTVLDALRARVTGALDARGGPPDPPTAALVALLSATDRLAAVTGLPKAEARRRAEAATAGDWAAPAVRAAVQEVHAVLVASMVATTAATTAATS